MEEYSMGLSRRKFTREFKVSAVKKLEEGASVGALSRALEVNVSVLHRWREEFHESPVRAFTGSERGRVEGDPVAALERKIGQQALEIDFLKGCLQRVEEQRQLQAHASEPPSTRKSKAGDLGNSR
jgi:transposase-like protein